MSIFEHYRRWRHSRGFGVHSPFAYSIVRDALHPPRGYAFYAEECPKIDVPRRFHSMKPRILLRLLLTLKVKNAIAGDDVVFLGADLPSAYSFAIKSAGMKVRKSPMKADFFIIAPDFRGKLPTLQPTQAMMIMDPAKFPDEIGNFLKKGLIIDSKKYRLLINRPEMALTRVKLP